MINGIVFWFFVFFVVYIYIGYPIILTLIASILKKTIQTDTITPKVTLLIAAYNEEEVITKKILNSLELDYPKEHLRIIVVADGSNDRTVEIVNSFAYHGVELSYDDSDRKGKMAAINHAMQKIHGGIVVFSDANNLYQKDALLKLVQPFSDSLIGGVSGSKRIIEVDEGVGRTDGLYWRYESFIKKQETLIGSCVGAVGEIFAIRRELFSSMNTKIINDDFWLAMLIVRHGYRVVYIPDAYSFEYSSSFSEERIRRSRIVAGRYQAMFQLLKLLPLNQPIFVWQAISHKFLRPFIPFAMIIIFFSNFFALLFPSYYSSSFVLSLLGLSEKWAGFFIILQFLFYFSAWLGKYLDSMGIHVKIFSVAYFFVSSNFAMLMGFIEYVTGKQTSVWQRVSRRM